MFKKLASLLLPLALTLSFMSVTMAQAIRFIPIAFHVHPSESVSRADIDAQLKLLNQIYNEQNSPFRFTVLSIDQIGHPIGDAKTLNVYIHDFTAPTFILAFASFPWEYSANPKRDGVHLRRFVVPDEATGVVLAHEIGHWLGIKHTKHPRRNGLGNCMDTPRVNPIRDKRCYFTTQQNYDMGINYARYRAK